MRNELLERALPTAIPFTKKLFDFLYGLTHGG